MVVQSQKSQGPTEKSGHKVSCGLPQEKKEKIKPYFYPSPPLA
jgi:hypothetical protein